MWTNITIVLGAVILVVGLWRVLEGDSGGRSRLLTELTLVLAGLALRLSASVLPCSRSARVGSDEICLRGGNYGYFFGR